MRPILAVSHSLNCGVANAIAFTNFTAGAGAHANFANLLFGKFCAAVIRSNGPLSHSSSIISVLLRRTPINVSRIDATLNAARMACKPLIRWWRAVSYFTNYPVNLFCARHGVSLSVQAIRPKHAFISLRSANLFNKINRVPLAFWHQTFLCSQLTSNEITSKP